MNNHKPNVVLGKLASIKPDLDNKKNRRNCDGSQAISRYRTLRVDQNTYSLGQLTALLVVVSKLSKAIRELPALLAAPNFEVNDVADRIARPSFDLGPSLNDHRKDDCGDGQNQNDLKCFQSALVLIEVTNAVESSLASFVAKD